MRGRRPNTLRIAQKDRDILRRTANNSALPWYLVRRARIVLGVAEGQRIVAVAQQIQCAQRTVHRICDLYQREGLSGLLSHPQRSGRPLTISPSSASANRPVGLSGARGERAAHHALVEL